MDKGFKYQGLIAPCGMSMLEDLDIINNKGLEAFLTKEESRWKCLSCGSGLSVHRDFCLNCKSEIN